MNSQSESARPGPVALEKHYNFLRWLMPAVEKFPRSVKFSLGERIEGAALDVLDLLIDATYSREPVALLRRINILLTRLRYLLRLSFDLRHLDGRRFEFAARAVDEIGRLVGGWIKACKENRGGGADPSRPARP